MALIGLLAVACALEMWAANVVLNLAGEQSLSRMSGLLPREMHVWMQDYMCTGCVSFTEMHDSSLQWPL